MHTKKVSFLSKMLCAFGVSVLTFNLALTAKPIKVFALSGEGTVDSPWLIGLENEQDVKAYLKNGTLYINGTGSTMNSEYGVDLPWLDEVTSVVIGSGITRIGDYLLHNSSVQSVSFSSPCSFESIGVETFKDCNSLTSITLPNTLKTLENGALIGTSLSSITLPESIESIGSFAFGFCTDLTSITIPTTTIPSLASFAFDYGNLDFNIYVPASATQSYKEAEGWNAYADKIVGYSTINDLLPTNFPTTHLTGWANENNTSLAYVYNDKIFIQEKNNPTSTFSFPITTILSNDGNNYKVDGPYGNICFELDDNQLVSLNVTNASYNLNGKYIPQTFVFDLLPEDFPLCVDILPANTWINENNINMMLIQDALVLLTKDGEKQKEITSNVKTLALSKDKNNYTYTDGTMTLLFVIEENNLVSINIEGLSNDISDFNGTYHAQHVHSIKQTHDGVEPTCFGPGHITYYECYCGKYFSDSDLTLEIEALDTWLNSIDGSGYIKATNNHKFEITYQWDGNSCTADAICTNKGCTEHISDTVIATYVKDSDATYDANEFGHYEASFTNSIFTKQVTQANSVEKQDTKLTKDGIKAGAIVAIVLGSLVGICLIAFAVMFFIKKKKR